MSEQLANFMQQGPGHCWKCHKGTVPNVIHIDCLNLPVTECTKSKCKRWYYVRVELERKLHGGIIKKYETS